MENMLVIFSDSYEYHLYSYLQRSVQRLFPFSYLDGTLSKKKKKKMGIVGIL